MGCTYPPAKMFRLLMMTFVPRILQLQHDKQQMADATLGEGDAPLQRMSNSLTARELTSVSSSGSYGIELIRSLSVI